MAEILSTLFPQDVVDGLGALVVVLFVLALLVTSVIQLLKERGVIADGQAGKWNAALSTTLMMLTFALTHVFGYGDQVLRDAEGVVEAIMALVTSSFLTALFAKIAYLGAKFIGVIRVKEAAG
jgi:hypothetical protein